MALEKARKELQKELIWMRGAVAKVEAVLALMDGRHPVDGHNGHDGNGHEDGHRPNGRRKYKMSATGRRNISRGRRKQLASKK